MVADVVLALAERGGHLADAVRAVAQEGEDAARGPVGQEGRDHERPLDVRRREVHAEVRQDREFDVHVGLHGRSRRAQVSDERCQMVHHLTGVLSHRQAHHVSRD